LHIGARFCAVRDSEFATELSTPRVGLMNPRMFAGRNIRFQSDSIPRFARSNLPIVSFRKSNTWAY
jgi:hypothetical protein